MRSRLRALTLSQEAPVGSMGQQGAAIWLGRQSPPDRTLASVRFLWQAQSQGTELSKTATGPHKSLTLRTHNTSRISQAVVTLSRVAAFCFARQIVRNFAFQFL